MRQTVTDLLVLMDNEEDAEKREMLYQKKELQEEKWMRAISYQRTFEKQKQEAMKLALKFLDDEDQRNFLESTGK